MAIDSSWWSRRISPIRPQGEPYVRPGRALSAPRLEAVGVLAATTLVAALGTADEFKNGLELNAWLGLVARHIPTAVLGIRDGETANSEASDAHSGGPR